MHGQDNYHTLELVNQSSEKPVLRSWRVSTVGTVNGCFLAVHDSHGILKIIHLFPLIDIACSRTFKTYQQKSEGGISCRLLVVTRFFLERAFPGKIVAKERNHVPKYTEVQHH